MQRTKAKRHYLRKRKCPRGCGAWWVSYVYEYPGGACCKTWWNRTGSDFSPMKNKACVTYRVEKVDRRWRTAKNPAWAKDNYKVRPCC